MEQLIHTIRQMISISEEELERFLRDCYLKTFRRKERLSEPGKVANDIFFVTKGILRVTITDLGGTEHTIHFALENQFIAEYSSFLQQAPAAYSLQALEDTEVVVLPRPAIEWGYRNLREGQKMGRLVAEYYFIYLDNRIKNLYAKSPKERYDEITHVFPDIHNRAPQHMIASYLGITSVHLSRLKKADRGKV